MAMLRVQLGGREVRHCHQLDFATSGVMLYALTKDAARRASQAFAERAVAKTYLALVEGHCEQPELECAAPVCQDPSDDFRMMVGDRDEVWPHDKKRRRHSGPAFTRLRVLVRGLYRSRPVTKVALHPTTGRRHQLRIHCRALGFPIVADATYAPNFDATEPRMMLHAYTLAVPALALDLQAPDPFLPHRLPDLVFLNDPPKESN